MSQLKMYWVNDGKEAVYPELPEGVSVVTLPELEDGIEKWLDIVQYGLTENGRGDYSLFERAMLANKGYDKNKCFFIVYEGKAVATVDVLCEDDTKHGIINMVACMPECRGKGFGTLLGRLAVYSLKQSGMVTAHLVTDDFRAAAIRSYLKVGFVPGSFEEDYRQRWLAILG